MDGIHHVTLPVADLPRAVAFYERLLEAEPLGPEDEENGADGADGSGTAGEPAAGQPGADAWLRVGGDLLRLTHSPGTVPEDDGPLETVDLALAVREPDLVALRARLDAGGHDYREATTSLRFRDPDGNRLAATTRSGPTTG